MIALAVNVLHELQHNCGVAVAESSKPFSSFDAEPLELGGQPRSSQVNVCGNCKLSLPFMVAVPVMRDLRYLAGPPSFVWYKAEDLSDLHPRSRAARFFAGCLRVLGYSGCRGFARGRAGGVVDFQIPASIRSIESLVTSRARKRSRIKWSPEFQRSSIGPAAR